MSACLALLATIGSASAAASPYQERVLADNPSSYFRLGEWWEPEAANEVAGAPAGAYGPWAWLGAMSLDWPDPAVRIEGANGLITVPDDPATGPTGDFALEAWIQPDAVTPGTGNEYAIAEKWGHDPGDGTNDGRDGFRLRLRDDMKVVGTVLGSTTAGEDQVISASPLRPGRWAHVVLSSDGVTLRLYVDGRQAGSTPARPAYALTRSPSELVLGGPSGPQSGSPAQPFPGVIDEPALYDHALNATQILQHYTLIAPAPEPVSPPVVSGTPVEGGTLTASPGTWSAPDAPTYLYYWRRCTVTATAIDTGCDWVANGRSASYTPVRDDVGSRLGVEVMAASVSGATAIAWSDVTPIVQSFDTTDPALALSGEAHDSAPGWLGRGSHPLHIVASDGSAQSPGSGITGVELKLDGDQVAHWTQSCETRNCSMTEDFSFDADSHSEGAHTMSAIATDDAGNTTTSSWTVKVDRTAPDLPIIEGTLREDMAAEHTAPSYTLDVFADDDSGVYESAGHSGVTSIELLVDGKRADYAAQPCQQGGCGLFEELIYSTASYGPGDHGARLVIADGAGNHTVKEWTVKGHSTTACQPQGAPSTAPVGDVDPGHAPITAAAATDAVASVEPKLVDQETVAADQPALAPQPDGSLVATGTDATTRVDANPRNGFSTTMDGTKICVRPAAVDPAAGETQAVADNAAIQPNTGNGADTVIKPTPAGVETFTSIRSGDAPEAHTWNVESPGNELHERNDGGVAVIDPNAHYTLADADPKPAVEPASPQEREDLINSDMLPPETVDPDPNAAAEATAAAGQIAPVQDELPDAATDHLVSQTPPEKPADAQEAATEADLQQEGQDAQTAARTRAANALDGERSVEELTNADLEAQHAAADQATLDTPVEVAEIPPPSATDANGLTVPVSLSVSGDDVTLHVDHGADGVAFPVVADPFVTVKTTRVDWRKRPVYRMETRLDHQEWQTLLIAWWPGAEIFRHPHTALGNGWYSVRVGGWVGTVVMSNQPSSPVYWVALVPIYKQVPVFDHDEWYPVIVEVTDRVWQDDPAPRMDWYTKSDDEPFDTTDEGSYDPLPSGNCAAAPADPEAPDSTWCGETSGSNPPLAAAKAQPAVAAAQPSPLFVPPACGNRQGTTWGLAEQQAIAFNDPRVTMAASDPRWHDPTPPSDSLAVSRARLIVPYDVAYHQNELDAVNSWISTVNGHCMEPLISFGAAPNRDDPNSTLDRDWHLPTLENASCGIGCPVPSYGPSVRKFVDDHANPSDPNLRVVHYTPWNEPNLYGASPATQGNSAAKRVGRYYQTLAKACVWRCVVAAGDFSDKAPLKNVTTGSGKRDWGTWFANYLQGASNGDASAIPIWAYHAYGLVNDDNLPEKRLRGFITKISGTSAKVWLTEQGGRVIPGGNPVSDAHIEAIATGQARTILGLPSKFQRVTRFYYYSWVGQRGYYGYNSGGKHGGLNAWDSGLVDWRGCDWHLAADGTCKYPLRAQWGLYKQTINPSWRAVP